MTQSHLENLSSKDKVQQQPEKQEDNNLINNIDFGKGIAGNDRTQFAPGLGSALTHLGLPEVDLTGFQQEAPYHSQGTVENIWHSIKHTVVKDPTLDDQVRGHIESQMNPQEKKAFDGETKARSEYQSQLRAWEESTMIPPPPMPKAPDTPMHEEIEKRVQQFEKDVTNSVRSKMSPEDLKRLDKQFKDYEQQLDDYNKPVNLKLAEMMMPPARPLPEPGHAIKDYYDRVSEETERRISDAASRK